MAQVNEMLQTLQVASMPLANDQFMDGMNQSHRLRMAAAVEGITPLILRH